MDSAMGSEPKGTWIALGVIRVYAETVRVRKNGNARPVRAVEIAPSAKMVSVLAAAVRKLLY